MALALIVTELKVFIQTLNRELFNLRGQSCLPLPVKHIFNKHTDIIPFCTTGSGYKNLFSFKLIPVSVELLNLLSETDMFS